ncbi:MAG: thioredoxin family protein [Paludibacteraceae bacterium]|nr:thioredoxin family protein [Paludibacteraceae bacterium]
MTLLLLILTILTPIHWNGVEKGDSVELTVTADEGWHLTVLSIGDSAIGQDFASGAVFRVAQETPIRYVACDDEQCLSPETYVYATAEAASTAVEPVAGNSLWQIFLLGLLGGLLAIFTPCVWPIIPMTVSFFLKRSGNRKSDALLYGLSIVVIYVGLGLLVTILFGASALNALATNAVLNLFFFALLVVFSLSFFGLFEITLPSSWSTKLDNQARQTGGAVSILLMAFTLVIVSFSCTGPIIGTLLVEAAGRALMAPAVGMLGFALALACPFALLAFFPEWLQRLPKSGEWLQAFKVSLAYVELAFSLKFLSVADMAYGWGILPRWLFFLLWGGCFVALAIHVWILLYRHLRTMWAIVMLIAFTGVSFDFGIYSLTGVFGAPVRAVAAFAPPMEIEGREVFNDYEEGMAYARQENRPVLLEFSGYGCVNCRKMEAQVLNDTQVQERMQSFVLITLYVDARQDANGNGVPDGEEFSKLQREQFGSNAQPYFVQLSAQGERLAEPFAFTTQADKFLAWLNTSPAPLPTDTPESIQFIFP